MSEGQGEFKPLNPSLFEGLQRAFGAVQIEKCGQKAIIETGQYRGEPSPHVVAWGETYRVCCPICHDTDFKMYVSHAFGTEHEPTGKAVLLANCFKHGNTIELVNRSLKFYSSIVPNKVSYAEAVDPPENRVVSPGRVIPVATGGADAEPARAYLRERGIDPDWAGDIYGLLYCVEGNKEVYGGLFEERLIIPCQLDGKLVGYQGRLLYNPPKDLKGLRFLRYLSMPGSWRGDKLMGLDQARKFQFAVIVEGPLDMVRQGPPVVATMGLGMGYRQCETVAKYWGGKHNMVVLVSDSSEKDRDARVRSLKNARTIRSLVRGRVYCPELPSGDPGEWERLAFFQFVSDQINNNRKVEITGGTDWFAHRCS